MAGEINLYDAFAKDYDNEGLCVLQPLDWYHKEVGNADSVLTVIHPYDAEGRHALLERGCILKAEVPVRTVPEIQNGAIIQTAELWTVRLTATKTERYQYTRATGGHRMKRIPAGYEVTVVEKGEERYKIKTSKYGTGWIAHSALEVKIVDVPYETDSDIEAATPSVNVRAQLFRITDVEKDDDKITVTAWHISYDWAGNMVTLDFTGDIRGQTFLNGLVHFCVREHDFNAVTDIGDKRISAQLIRTNPIAAILGEGGFIQRYGGELIRDNFDLTILRRAGMDRGFTIEYAKNLTGITFNVSDDGVVTSIVPIGKNEDGGDLYLDGQIWVDAPNSAEFAVPRIKELQVEDAKVGEGVTEENARDRMLEAVQAEWDKGVHLPTMSVKVSFERLGDTAVYSQYKELEKCYLYDTVRVWHPKICGEQSLTVVSQTWNGMQQRYTECELGALGLRLGNSKITNLQLPNNISGLKIAPQSIGGAQLGSETIATRHLQAGSVQTEALAAGSIITEHMQAGSIDADRINADTLKAVVGEFYKLIVKDLEADNITVDNLTADFIDAILITANAGKFDQATVDNLVANSMLLQHGNAGEVFIKNLQLIDAQVINATIKNCVIQGKDGKYYELDIDEDGNVTGKNVTVTEGELAAAVTSSGKKVILETDLVVDNLGAVDIKSRYALIDKITAASIDVAQLFAREAFITTLRTAKITSAGDSIEMIASKAAQSNVYTGVNPPANPAEGQLWVDTGVDPTVLRSWMGYDIDADREIPAGKLTADVITFDAAMSQGDIEYSTKFEPHQEGEGDPYPPGGGKNLLNIEAFVSSGVTQVSAITANLQDSVLTLQGVPTRNYEQIFNTLKSIAAENYIGKQITLSGIVEGQKPMFSVQFKNATGIISSVTLSATGAATAVVPEGTTYILAVACLNGYGYVGEYCEAIYKNMQLEIGDIATEYASYSNIRPLGGYDSLKLVNCGKNLLQNTATSQTINGVTFTVNADGSVVANGTATADTFFTIDEKLSLKSGKHIISGCPAGGGLGKYGLYCRNVQNGINVNSDVGSGITVDFLNNAKSDQLSGYSEVVSAVPGSLQLGIIKQPENVTAFVNTEISFSVEAMGENLTYQWEYWNTVNWANNSINDTAKTAELAFTVKSYHDGYKYRCLITDGNGNQVRTKEVVISLKTIIIAKQPESIVTPLGSMAIFSVEAQGNGLSYGWQFKTQTGTDWMYSGMTGNVTPSISLEATEGRSGYQYRCVISDASGNQVISDAASLTVGDAMVTLDDTVEPPKNVSALSVDAASIRVIWDVVEHAAGYKVYRSTANGLYSVVATIDDSETTEWIDTGLATGTTYYYRVMAIASGGYFNTSIVIFNGFTASNLTFYPMIRLASEEDSTYEPYLGNTYTVQLGDTIYGGSYNWKTGLLTVDRKIAVIDRNTPYLTAITGNHGYRIQRYDFDGNVGIWPNNSTVAEGLFCDQLKTVSANALFSTETNAISLARLTPMVQVCIEGLTTKDEFAEWLNATPITVVYPLAEPFTIQYDPQKIELPESDKVTAFSTPGETSILSKISGWDTITADTVALEEMMAEAVLDINSDIENLQSQIDGNITTWFYKYPPTMENEPASKWTDDAAKNNHLGDLFYDETTGYCYRFQLSDGVYGWKLIQDTDIAKALADAKNAQDTADNKRRVFYDTPPKIPTPPYDVGDLWVQGSNGDILRCSVARAADATGSLNDWVNASKYTDDTVANETKDQLKLRVSGVDIEYAKNQDPNNHPAEDSKEWSTNVPTWQSGYYIWSRTVYVRGTAEKPEKVYSGYTCLTTATSKSVKNIQEQFYVSTSKTEPMDGVWTSVSPSWSAGTYLWIRFVITYDDNTSVNQKEFLDETWSAAERTMEIASAARDQADAALKAARDAVTLPDFERVIRVKPDGLHVGDNKTSSEVLIDSASVNVVVNGVTYSTFGPGFLQLGDDIRVRRPSVGGIAFSPIVKESGS